MFSKVSDKIFLVYRFSSNEKENLILSKKISKSSAFYGKMKRMQIEDFHLLAKEKNSDFRIIDKNENLYFLWNSTQFNQNICMVSLGTDTGTVILR